MAFQPSQPAPPTAASPSRRSYLDWLRVIALIGLLVYHVNMIFDPLKPWLVKSPEQWAWLTILDSFVSQWRLPLLFLVSGAGTFFALGYRSAASYVRNRFQRLIIPFIFGVLIVVPPQVYFQRLASPPAEGAPLQTSLLHFYPSFWLEQIQAGDFRLEHVWFLRHLFVFSLVALPLFLWLRSLRGVWLGRLSDRLAQGRRVLLLTLPVVLVELALVGVLPHVPGMPAALAAAIGAKGVQATYFTFFVYGFLIAASEPLSRAIFRNRHLALALGLVALVLQQLAINFSYTLAAALSGKAMAWLLVASMLGYAQAYLSRPNPLLRHANGLVLPFYVLHQTVIVVVAYYVLPWPIPAPLHYLAILAGSFIITALLCALMGQNIAGRLVMGMDPPRAPSGARPAVGLGRES